MTAGISVKLKILFTHHAGSPERLLKRTGGYYFCSFLLMIFLMIGGHWHKSPAVMMEIFMAPQLKPCLLLTWNGRFPRSFGFISRVHLVKRSRSGRGGKIWKVIGRTICRSHSSRPVRYVTNSSARSRLPATLAAVQCC